MKPVTFASRTAAAVGAHTSARSSLSIDVGAGRGLGSGVAPASELGGRLLFFAPTLGYPFCPVLPPSAAPLLRLGEPFVGAIGRLGAGEKVRLRIARGIDEAGDVPGIAEH